MNFLAKRGYLCEKYNVAKETALGAQSVQSPHE